MEFFKTIANYLGEADFMAEIIVGLLAFFGAYLGTKSIRRQLTDSYIETRVTKALNVNDKVLSKTRFFLSELEQTYTENRPVSEDDLDDVIDQCKEISSLSEDGGKEVSTIAFLLYHTVEDLQPRYESKTKDGDSHERLITGSFIGFVDQSLRLIIEYCSTSTPIPYKAALTKRSSIKRGIRKYLSDKGYYSLKNQPFGITLNPNSEVVLRFSAIVGSMSTALYRKKLFMFLQSNLPIVYELISGKIYMPVVLSQENGIEFFGKQELHLIKVQSIKSFGTEGGDYFDFYYSNISPRLRFVDGYKLEKLRDEFVIDSFMQEQFSLNDYKQITRRTDETISVRVEAEKARKNFKNHKWKIRYYLIKQRFLH